MNKKVVIGTIIALIVVVISVVIIINVNSGDKPEKARGKYKAEINIKDYGRIELELDGDVAPITVANFLKLAREGFYDGLTFHRIIKDYMMQGGDPSADGTGGSDTKIKGEFAANGVKNMLSHERGVISMAHSEGDNNSASSQFFIMQKDRPAIDGQYAGFGHVTSGMEVVDKICNEVKPEDTSSGKVAKENQPVIESIKIIE